MSRGLCDAIFGIPLLLLPKTATKHINPRLFSLCTASAIAITYRQGFAFICIPSRVILIGCSRWQAFALSYQMACADLASAVRVRGCWKGGGMGQSWHGFPPKRYTPCSPPAHHEAGVRTHKDPSRPPLFVLFSSLSFSIHYLNEPVSFFISPFQAVELSVSRLVF